MLILRVRSTNIHNTMREYKNLIYTGSNNRKSPFDLYLADQSSNKPLVIFAHGYKGFKDWGSWDLVGQTFAEAGYDFLKFNFSHNGGTVDNPIDFPDLEAYSENTYSRELEDMEAITRLVHTGIEVDGKKRSWDKYALIGHSRGGGIVIIHAAGAKNVSHLATWASVADYGERFNFDLEEWKKTGVTTVRNGRTNQDMPHKYAFYQDYIENEEKLSIENAARKIEIPWLIAHGDTDEAVDLEEAQRLARWSNNAKSVVIAGGTHTFGASHPRKNDKLPDTLKVLVMKTIEFFNS